MNRGASRTDVFRDAIDRQVFLEILARVCAKTSAEIHAYCLMTNHFHLIIRTPDGNLDEVMRLLCGRYARYFNDRYGKDGGLCRGRYKAILVDSDRYLLAVSRYVHRNPLAFWTRPLENYPWSSYAMYLGLRPAPVWLATEETLAVAGGTETYESIVRSPLPSDVDRIYGGTRMPVVLGSKTFRTAALDLSAKGSGAIRPKVL